MYCSHLVSKLDSVPLERGTSSISHEKVTIFLTQNISTPSTIIQKLHLVFDQEKVLSEDVQLCIKGRIIKAIISVFNGTIGCSYGCSYWASVAVTMGRHTFSP